MRQLLGLPDMDGLTRITIMNDNRGSLDWIESGCRPTQRSNLTKTQKLIRTPIEEAKPFQ